VSVDLSSHSNFAARAPLRFVVRRAIESDRRSIVSFLERDSASNLYPLAWLQQSPRGLHSSFRASTMLLADAGVGARDPNAILGICLIVNDNMAIPSAAPQQVARAFGARLRARSDLDHMVGEANACAWTWDAYGRGMAPRLEQTQNLYRLVGAPRCAGVEPVPLRLATLQDADLIVAASGAMYREETLSDPALEAPMAFRSMVCRSIDRQKVWMWMRGTELLFKAEVSNSYDGGAMISGVFTPPRLRRRGYARRGLCTLLQHLSARFPQVVLYVNGDNEAAIRLYDALGFRYHCPYRTIYIQ